MIVRKIVLVNPPVWDVRAPPINISYLKAFLVRQGYDVVALDLNIELFNRVSPEQRRLWKPDFHDWWQNEDRFRDDLVPELGDHQLDRLEQRIAAHHPDVVGFTINYSPHLVRELSRRLKARQPDLVTIVGGNYAEPFIFGGLLLHEAAVDILVRGEGEQTLLEILQALEAEQPVEGIPGTVVRRDSGVNVEAPPRDRLRDLDALPVPDWSDYDLDLYWEEDHSKKTVRLPLLSSRGCIAHCDFCLQKSIWGRPYTHRSADNLFAEVRRNVEEFGVHLFQFSDLAINGHLPTLERFCDLVIESGLDIGFGGGCNIRKGMTPILLAKARQAGCEWLDHGLESGADRVLQAMGKPYDAATARDYIKAVHNAGIAPQFSLIVGHPSETPEAFAETLEFLRSVAPYIGRVIPSVSVCGIYPNTPLHRDISNYGGDPEHDVWMDWKIAGNDFDERRRRVRELNEVVREFCNETGIKIDDEETFRYREE